MNKIIWNENYCTGVDQIDRQHFFLVNRINELSELKDYKEDISNLYPILLLFISYAQFHFDYEKDYLSSNGYPKLEEYLEDHKKFIKIIDQFNELYIDGLGDIDEELLSYLNKWLLNHISGKDMNFIKERTEKGEKNGD